MFARRRNRKLPCYMIRFTRHPMGIQRPQCQPLALNNIMFWLSHVIVSPGRYSFVRSFNSDIEIKNQPLIPATGIHCKKLLKEAKIDVGEITINSIPDVPIWNSEPVTVDFTLSEFDKSSASSTVFKSRFNELRQKYSDFCHIYTDGSKVERKVASAYVCPYGTRSYGLRDGCSIFTAEVEAIDKALKYVKVSSVERFVIFSDSMSVLQAIESQE